MSRIGRKPIILPPEVTMTIAEGNVVTVKGPKGQLCAPLHKDMILEKKDNTVEVKRPTEEKKHKSLHGLTRTLLSNMVEGVTKGFTKDLEISGVGYRASKQGKVVTMNLGYSHQVFIEENDDIKIDVPAPNKLTISGIDKQKVGQFAAEVRGKRPPEPYKGKGIKYATEVIKRKEGKTGGKGKK
jgi:large subunit ribosomal protein L6